MGKGAGALGLGTIAAATVKGSLVGGPIGGIVGATGAAGITGAQVLLGITTIGATTYVVSEAIRHNYTIKVKKGTDYIDLELKNNK